MCKQLYFEHTQVIEETLRTHCPVRGPFKESPVGGVNLSGCNVPGGTMIFVSITALNTVGSFCISVCHVREVVSQYVVIIRIFGTHMKY